MKYLIPLLLIPSTLFAQEVTVEQRLQRIYQAAQMLQVQGTQAEIVVQIKQDAAAVLKELKEKPKQEPAKKGK